MISLLERYSTIPNVFLQSVSLDVASDLALRITEGTEDVHQIWKSITDMPFQLSVQYVVKVITI